MVSSSLEDYFQRQKTIILDGGLATELEERGYNLNTKLWSAELLLKNPNAIRDVHLDYLRAGADVIITSSYQASIPAFTSMNVSVCA